MSDEQLTRHEWDLLQLLLPCGRHADELRLHAVVSRSVALLLRMLDDTINVVLAQRVEHIERVVAIRHPALRQIVREERHQLLILLNHGPNVLDAELVVLGHVDEDHVLERD